MASWSDINILPDGTTALLDHYGIAVGEDIVDPPEEDPPEDPGEKPTDTAPDGNAQRQKLAGLLRPILEAELRRSVKKVGTLARARSKDPKRFTDWLEVLEAENRTATAEWIAHTLAALSTLRGRSIEPQAVADDLLKRLAAPLVTLTEQCTAKELEARVEQRMTELESFLPELMAGELLEAPCTNTAP